MKHAATLILLVFFVLSLPSAGWAEAADHTIEQQIAAWLSDLDAKQYKDTWNATAPLFRSQVNLKKWRKMAAGVRNPLGAFQSRRLMAAVYASNLPGAPTGDYITFQYSTHFGAAQAQIETVVAMRVGQQWQVSGYFVKPQT